MVVRRVRSRAAALVADRSRGTPLGMTSRSRPCRRLRMRVLDRRTSAEAEVPASTLTLAWLSCPMHTCHESRGAMWVTVSPPRGRELPLLQRHRSPSRGRRRSKGGDDGGAVGRVWSRTSPASTRRTSHEPRYPAGTRGGRQPGTGGPIGRWLTKRVMNRVRRKGEAMGMGFNALVLTTIRCTSGRERNAVASMGGRDPR